MHVLVYNVVCQRACHVDLVLHYYVQGDLSYFESIQQHWDATNCCMITLRVHTHNALSLTQYKPCRGCGKTRCKRTSSASGRSPIVLGQALQDASWHATGISLQTCDRGCQCVGECAGSDTSTSTKSHQSCSAPCCQSAGQSCNNTCYCW